MKEDFVGNGRASVEHSQAAQLPQIGGDPKDAVSENQLDSFAFGNATDAGDRTLKATKLRYTCLFFGTILLHMTFLVRHIHGAQSIKLRSLRVLLSSF